MNRITSPDDINVLILQKKDERYIFLFKDDTRAEVLRTFGRFSCNEDLSFSWYDSAILSQKVQKLFPSPEPPK